MIIIDDIELSPDLLEGLKNFHQQIEDFRKQGPLDKIASTKLEEHFKASHIYNSAGIEGNRLTLQETMVVLSDGIDISGKPIQQSVEVRHLGKAYDLLRELSKKGQTLRETDIRSLHSLLIGESPDLMPGEYRKTGVIISGSEHRPPEPIAVPSLMEELVNWINQNIDRDPIIVSAIAQHQFVYIHPFKDGNGRVSRLLMNLILLKKGYPICNITREQRSEYYEILSFADVGLYEPLIQKVYKGCHELFSEYLRIKVETDRAAEWAEKWGQTEEAVVRKRENRELDLWQSRMKQVYLEFERAADLLDEKFQNIDISTYQYSTEIDLDKYQNLKIRGSAEYTNFFSIAFKDQTTGISERFMFRFFRNWEKFQSTSRIIPLELNYFEKEDNRFIRLCEVPWNEKIRLRELFFTDDGLFTVRFYDFGKKGEVENHNKTISKWVQFFFDDVLKNILNLSF